MTLPVLLSIPHGSTHVPPDLADLMVATPRDVFDDGDPFTELLYDLDGEVHTIVRAHVARAVVDLNRDRHDRPPENPDGVIKSETCHAVPIWRHELWQDSDKVEHVLAAYYFPFHHALTQAANQPDVRLGLDCHSMAEHPPAISADNSPRPLFCLSNRDGETCDDQLLSDLAAALAETFEVDPDQIGLNRPFRGGHITAHHGNNPLPWIQLELNRSMYLKAPWYDEENQHLDPAKIADFRGRLLSALKHAVE